MDTGRFVVRFADEEREDMPIEDGVAKWKREAEEQEARFAAARAERREADLEARITAVVEQRLAAVTAQLQGEIANQHELVLELAQSLGEYGDALAERVERAFNKLQRAIEDARPRSVRDDDDKPIDELPNPIARHMN